MILVLCPVGKEVLDEDGWLKKSLGEVFGFKVVDGPPLLFIDDALNRRRNQYLAGALIAKLATLDPCRGNRILGVTEVDLYAPGLNFVFGQADVKLKTAIISVLRLKPEFYQLPRDVKLFRERVLKEAVHEIGHTFGLGHCINLRCVMHFSNCLADTDLKGSTFCPECQPGLFGIGGDGD